MAIDIDANKIFNLKTNIRIFGVESQIDVVCKDALAALDSLEGDAVFCSPPWNGLSYQNEDRYDAFKQVTPDLNELIKKSLKCTQNISLLLPKNTDIPKFVRDLAELLVDFEKESKIRIPRLIYIERYLYVKNPKMILVVLGRTPLTSDSRLLDYLWTFLNANGIAIDPAQLSVIVSKYLDAFVASVISVLTESQKK